MTDKDSVLTTLDSRRNQSMTRKKLFEEMILKEIPGTKQPNEPMHAVLEGELGENEMIEGQNAQIVRNRALIHYVVTLADSNSTNDLFDFQFVETLLQNGADINSTDKTGQPVFHEVARSWNRDVAGFLIEKGANVNQQDQFGRSPLHVAAAVDFAEMVEFLLENGADIDIKTYTEEQTAVHFAEILLGHEVNIDVRDSKNRTPLQVAAGINRCQAAKFLIKEGAPAGVYDNAGNSALSLLIEKIPEVALDAMDQFHSEDMITRKEFYFLNYLEGTKLKEENTPARTPLEIAVQNERFDVIMHPVMRRLIDVKWKIYGKRGAVIDLVLNIAYTILWTVLSVTLPAKGRELYVPLAPNFWRLIVGILLILLTIIEIRKQLLNTRNTRNEQNAWKEWRASELEEDIKFCHPRWPQEVQYVRAEIKAVRNLSLMSGSDWWIYFDWVALVFILANIASHIAFFQGNNDLARKVYHYINIPLLLILWFRILKYARPFESAGPFIVIFGSSLGDVMKWGFLNFIVFVPFTCAFWITFGAISSQPVRGYENVGSLLYNIFVIMTGNPRNFEELENANPFMARLLCASFIAIGAILTLNLLIALLTNTFERLYENAMANAVMQRARTILLLQKSLRKDIVHNYYDFIKKNGSPEVISKNFGPLMTINREEQATIVRLRDDMKTILRILVKKFGKRIAIGKKCDSAAVDVENVTKIIRDVLIHVRNIQLSIDELKGKFEQAQLVNLPSTVTSNLLGNAVSIASTVTNTSAKSVAEKPSLKFKKHAKDVSEDWSEETDSEISDINRKDKGRSQLKKVQQSRRKTKNEQKYRNKNDPNDCNENNPKRKNNKNEDFPEYPNLTKNSAPEMTQTRTSPMINKPGGNVHETKFTNGTEDNAFSPLANSLDKNFPLVSDQRKHQIFAYPTLQQIPEVCYKCQPRYPDNADCLSIGRETFPGTMIKRQAPTNLIRLSLDDTETYDTEGNDQLSKESQEMKETEKNTFSGRHSYETKTRSKHVKSVSPNNENGIQKDKLQKSVEKGRNSFAATPTFGSRSDSEIHSHFLSLADVKLESKSTERLSVPEIRKKFE